MDSLRSLRFAAPIFLCVAAAVVAFAADDDALKSMPDGPGKYVLTKMCSDCHGPENIRALRLDKNGWADKVSEMIDRGAEGTDADIEAVTEYLATNFGPNSKVVVNTAPIGELKAVLGFSTDEAQAIIAYRTRNGKFTNWHDLLKVPGIDPAKVESVKDKMAF